MKSEHRGVIRLRVDKGLVLLRHQDMPVFACSLLDLSETGCRCEAILKSIDHSAAKAWKELLKPGLHLNAEISRPPGLGNLHIKMGAEITRVDPNNVSGIELGLHFIPSGESTERMQRALLKIAKDKLTINALPSEPATEKPPEKEAPAPANHEDEIMHASQEICDILIGQGRLKVEQVQAARIEATATNTSVTRMLMKHHGATPVEICHALSKQSGLPIADLLEYEISPNLWKMFTFLTMQRYEFMPISETKEQIFIAAAHPLSIEVLNALERTVRRPIFVFLAPLDQIQNLQFHLRPQGAHAERHHPRTKTLVHAVYQYCNEQGINLDDQEHGGTVYNMSDGGVLVLGPAEIQYTPAELLKRGTFVRIEFYCENRPIHALCKIKHIEPTRKDPKEPLSWALGLEISRIDPAEAKRLRDACDHAETEQLKKRERGFHEK